MSAPAPLVLDRAWLADRGLLAAVLREQILDEALADVVVPPEALAALPSAAEQRAWRRRRFQEQRWQAALPAYFLQRKSALDQAVYWLLRTRDRLLARELYFRIKEGEEDFASVATAHSAGPEADTCGLLGPTPLGQLAPGLAKLLLESPPGTLRPPVQIGEWIVVVRVHRILPCALDADMETRLYDELLDAWLAEQLPARLS